MLKVFQKVFAILLCLVMTPADLTAFSQHNLANLSIHTDPSGTSRSLQSEFPSPAKQYAIDESFIAAIRDEAKKMKQGLSDEESVAEVICKKIILLPNNSYVFQSQEYPSAFGSLDNASQDLQEYYVTDAEHDHQPRLPSTGALDLYLSLWQGNFNAIKQNILPLLTEREAGIVESRLDRYRLEIAFVVDDLTFRKKYHLTFLRQESPYFRAGDYDIGFDVNMRDIASNNSLRQGLITDPIPTLLGVLDNFTASKYEENKRVGFQISKEEGRELVEKFVKHITTEENPDASNNLLERFFGSPREAAGISSAQYIKYIKYLPPKEKENFEKTRFPSVFKKVYRNKYKGESKGWGYRNQAGYYVSRWLEVGTEKARSEELPKKLNKVLKKWIKGYEKSIEGESGIFIELSTYDTSSDFFNTFFINMLGLIPRHYKPSLIFSKSKDFKSIWSIVLDLNLVVAV